MVIPKSVRRERMAENFNVFDFTLDNGDMEKIATLNTENSSFFSHYDPELIEFLSNYKQK